MYELRELLLPTLFLFGALQGGILASILAFSSRFNNAANRYLALLVFTISVLNIYGGFQLLRVNEYYPAEGYFPYFLVNLIPICLYFFTLFLTNKKYKFSRTDYLLFIPFVFDLSHQIFCYVQYLQSGVFTETRERRFEIVLNLFELYAAIATLVVIIFSIKRLKEYQHKLETNFSDIDQKSLSWVKGLYLISIPLAIMWIINAISDINPSYYLETVAILIWIGLTVIIYWLSYSMLMRPELHKHIEFAVEDSQQTLRKEVISQKDAEDILRNLSSSIETSKAYLNPDLNLSELAKLVQTSDKKLSTVLNQHLDTNFYEYINKHRIELFKQQIKAGRHKELSMIGMALECGFKSKSSFYRAFKKHIGVTPSQYLRQSQS